MHYNYHLAFKVAKMTIFPLNAFFHKSSINSRTFWAFFNNFMLKKLYKRKIVLLQIKIISNIKNENGNFKPKIVEKFYFNDENQENTFISNKLGFYDGDPP